MVVLSFIVHCKGPQLAPTGGSRQRGKRSAVEGKPDDWRARHRDPTADADEIRRCLVRCGDFRSHRCRVLN